jgi:8-oxo-dGTP pyrophosphatase MutT (NUDIX family)
VQERVEAPPSLVRAAVLAPVFERAGELHLVFIERSGDVPVHRGQIAFPGGVCRAEDATCLDTALREAEEEIGLRRADVAGTEALPEVQTMTSGFVISPFVGRVPAEYPFRLDPREVAGVFFVPLSELRDHPRRHIVRTLSDGSEREVPTYVVGERIIWGATEMITREILKVSLGFTHSS